MKTYEGFVYQNHNFSMFVHLLCQTKNTGSEMKKKTKRKNAEDEWTNEEMSC